MFSFQRSFTQPTEAAHEAQFYALVRDRQWNEDIDRFRQTGDASLKRKLPAFIFQATFDETTSKAGRLGRWRKQAATRLTGLVVMDVDHLGSERPTPDPSREGRGEAGAEKEAMPGNMNLLPRELFAKWQKEMPGLFSTSTAQPTPSLAGGMPAGQGGSSILLVYVTPSGRGLKIVFKARPEWGNLIDNQHAMARLLGVEVDESCKDASRMSFICKEEDILFIDKELFTYENKAFAEKYNDKYRSGKSGAEKREAPPAQAQTTSSFRGIPYASIIQTWWQLNGGEPVEGERNVKLYQLAVNLRTICDNKAEVLMKVMPRLGLDEQELRGIVESACKEPPKGISKMLQEVLKRLSPDTTQAQPTPLPDGSGQGVGLPLANWGSELEAMFQHFPILKDVCQGLKPAQYPAALFVGGGLLMTLMTRCTYHFYHRPREVRRLNSSTLIIGDPASGKSFATRLYDLLAAPIIEADQAGKDAVNAYRDLMRSKGANKDKPKKPQVVIRDHPARTSNAQFIQDMVNSVEEVDGEKMQLHMFTFDSELDNTLRLQRGGSWIDKESMELKAFHNEVDGQAYSNSDSVIQNFKVYWNYIYTGTPLALKRKVNSQNFGSGLATRLSVIPLPATRFEMIGREQDEDMGSDQRLSEWARKLDRTKGELPLQKIVDRLYEWTARRMADAEENDSQADEMLLKRCAYHGVNFAAPFIVMRHWKAIHKDGNYYCCGTFETDEVDWQLAELIVNIQYACQRHFFGHLAEEYFEAQQMEASANVRHQQKTIRAFEQLPREFTAEDVMRCFHLKSHSTASTRICRLVEDRVVKKVSEYVENGTTKARYQKTGVILN